MNDPRNAIDQITRLMQKIGEPLSEDQRAALAGALYKMTFTAVNDRLFAAAKAVVEARYYGQYYGQYYSGDNCWDRLKNAIGELEEIVYRD